jgi:hypothetical protein
VGILIIFFIACLRPPDYSLIPEITFIELDTTEVTEMTDSVTITFGFTDGDGDLGALDGDTLPNTFIKDSRTGFIYTYQFPSITPDGNVKDISGTVEIILPGITCVPNVNVDQLTYEVYITDRAGNKSNSVTTPALTIYCN